MKRRTLSLTMALTMAASMGLSVMPAAAEEQEVKEFTAFHAVPGTEINDDNVCQDAIAALIGAKCKDTWLTGQTAEEAVGMIIASEEYPDFMTASTGHSMMMDAGAYIAIDEYWDNYPNIKNYLSESEWNKVRAEDGHIYIIPQFGIINGHDTSTVHNDEAFWIQTRVLKWAGYPDIVTLEDYFNVIEEYIEANPTMEDGTPNIGYTILCEDWRYFCLENAPFFLDGYPNDGCVIIDPETLEVIDYNTTETAKEYFAKLNEEFHKGIVDPESFTQTYDQYIAKLSTGRVLGMCDQHWDFQTGEEAIKQQGLDDCTYVPLGLVIEEGIEEHYHSASALDVSNGLGITIGCDDVEGALQFVNDLLSQEVQTLRFWGIEGVDYEVDENGLFYRTEEQRANATSTEYKVANRCDYSYFPQYEGMNLDGINAWSPDYQPTEFYESLSEDVKECLAAYGAETYVEMLNPSEENQPWFPMWSFSNNMTTETPGGMAWTNMAEVKHEYLPKVCMAEDFEAAWEEYLGVYNDRCDIEAFLGEIEEELHRRIAVASGETAE
ncbi:MAG: extracellular solute-binding protein [Lachnospiraceae bacterium]|nr:extracellular solute-binding protein [Lachnospiraceae bacterium]